MHMLELRQCTAESETKISQEFVEDHEEQQEQQGSYSIPIPVVAVTNHRALASRKQGRVRAESTKQVNYQ